MIEGKARPREGEWPQVTQLIHTDPPGCTGSTEHGSPHIFWANGTQPRQRNKVMLKKKITALAEFCFLGERGRITGYGCGKSGTLTELGSPPPGATTEAEHGCVSHPARNVLYARLPRVAFISVLCPFQGPRGVPASLLLPSPHPRMHLIPWKRAQGYCVGGRVRPAGCVCVCVCVCARARVWK